MAAREWGETGWASGNGGTAPARRGRPAAVLGGLAVACFLLFVAHSLLLAESGPGWADSAIEAIYIGFFVITAALCALRAARGSGRKAPWLAFALGLLLQGGGWAYYFLVIENFEAPPYPSISDALWLGYYVAVFAGLILLLRARMISDRVSLWADSVIAATALGSVGAAILVDSLIASTGASAAAIATTLAYPLSDFLVLTLVISAFALTRWHPGPLWTIVGVAFAIQIVTDVIYLSKAAAGTYEPGTILDASWMLVALLITYAAWRPGGDPKPHVRRDGWRMMAPPATFTLIAVTVLVYSSFVDVHPSAVVLAVVALLGSIVRMLSESLHQRRMSELARRDPLTGLLNHREFHLAVERELESAEAGPVSVVLFDVDGFKRVNDDYGHAEGDRLLREVAQVLRSSTRAEDAAARLGGDEFGLLLPAMPEYAATAVGKRVQLAVAGLDAGVAISFGVAEWPTHGPTKEMMMLRADMALYESKPEVAEHRRLRGVAEAARVDPARLEERVQRILAIAREQLGMAVAYVSEFTGGEQVFRGVDGDGESFGLEPGNGIPLEETYCQRLTDGRLPSLICDARADERASALEVTAEADLGAYIGVPLVLPDGRLYGTLCCASHSPEPALARRDVEFMQVLARLLAEEIDREQREVEERTVEEQSISLGGLLAALDARDRFTGAHSESVVELAAAVAHQLRLPNSEVTAVRQVALLHDVGKIGIPDSILRKEGPLSTEEWRLMREHPEIGARLVEAIRPLAHLAPMVRAAHERWDGGDYPDGLAGEEIPLVSRIVFACDAHDAMTSDRPYRSAMSQAEARRELEANAGTQFDPVVVNALLTVLERKHAVLHASRSGVRI